MSQGIVSQQAPVALVGGGRVAPQVMADISQHVGAWIAADGGASVLAQYGYEPKAIIGDLDSLSPAMRLRFADRIHHIAEQDSTDFDKALRSVSAPLVFGLGFTGGRMDHTLAALSVLVKRPDKKCLLVDEDNVIFHCPPVLQLALPEGADIGLYPLAPLRVASKGLVWPTDGLDFAPDGQIGTSNKTAQPVQELRPDRAGLLGIVPVKFLPQVIVSISNRAD